MDQTSSEIVDRFFMTRRAFLKRLGLTVGMAASISPLTALARISGPRRPLKVVIVGAGLAGLCAAYELEQRGHEVLLLEANARRIGGRVYTHHFGNGLYGEFGAMRIPANHALTHHYVRQFGLSLRPFVQSNPEAFYYLRGQRLRIKDEPLLNQFYDLTQAEKTQSLFDFWSQSVLNVLAQLTPDEIADLRHATVTSDKMRLLDQLSLEAIFKRGGLSAEAIELLSVAWGYETYLASAITEVLREEHEETWLLDFYEIIGGTDLLPKAFAARLKTTPRMGAEVIRIEHDGHAGSVTAIYKKGGAFERAEGDVLLCTVPLGVLSHIEIVPGLPGSKQRAIRQVSYDSSTKVLAVVRERFWESQDGIYGGGTTTDLPTGFTYYPSDNADARDSAVSKGPGVLLASYTWGQPARRLAALSGKERTDTVINTLAKVHPQLRQPGMVTQVVSWSWDTYPFSQGAFCWFSPSQHEGLYRYLVEPEGVLFFAGEHTSLTHTWMQGALESALRAVQQILQLGDQFE